MGSSIDRFLQETDNVATPTPVQPSKKSGFDSWLTGADDDATLGLAVQKGVTRNGDQAARVLRLQTRTGLPEDLITRNLDQVESEARKADFDPVKYRMQSPVVAKWLAEDPNHVAVAGEDLTKLSWIERQFRNIKDQFNQGRTTTELSSIGEAAILGNITPQQRARQAELERQNAQQNDYGITGFFDGIPGAVANQIPIFGATLLGKTKGAAVGAASGAAVGAGIALVAGQAGPQVAAPEEVVTVPGAALAGAKTGGTMGWRYGAGVAAGRMEASLAYLEFEKVRDENGLPLDRSTMLGASAITGVVNGALEMAGFESMLKSVPGLRALGRDGIKHMLATPTLRAAITHYAKTVGESMVTEGATEFMQDIVKDASGTLATMIQDGSIKNMSSSSILSKIFSDEHIAEAIADAKAGAQGGGGMTATMGAASLHADVRRAKTAQQTAASFAQIGEQMQDSKLLQRMPEKMQEVIEHLTKDGPQEFVYTPVETWNEYWQSKNVDPGEVAKEVLGGTTEAYDEAMRTGGDIQIPTARYATTIAPTEHNTFFLQEMRTNPADMNAREAAEFVKQLDAQDQQQTEAAASTETSAENVRTKVVEQLVNAGFDENTANQYAALYESGFRTLGERTGTTAEELYNRYNLTVTRSDAPTAATSPQQNTELHQSPSNIPTAPRFISKAETLVQDKMGNSATVQQIQGMLKDVKAEERQWLGLDEFLATKDKFTKDELASFIKAHQLAIEEVEPGSDGVDEHQVALHVADQIRTYAEEQAEKELGPRTSGLYSREEYEALYHEIVTETINAAPNDAQLMDQLREIALEDINAGEESQNRYEQYKLPGGEDYHELLFTLPDISEKYASGHFEQDNIFAHTRFDTRTDTEGRKVLFLEEIQSDWHQAGREHGYVTPENTQELESIRDASNAAFTKAMHLVKTKYDNLGFSDAYDALNTISKHEDWQNRWEVDPEDASVIEDFRVANGAYKAIKSRLEDGVPEAPFKKTWHEYVLKRMIRYAAEKGFDAIGWTTGQQQNERYQLEKQITGITYNPDTQALSTKPVGNSWYRMIGTYAPEELHTVVGKELAVRLMTAKINDYGVHEISGEQLTIGGDGMKGFYDRIIPQFLNKFGKKFGAKVEDGSVQDSQAVQGGSVTRERSADIHELVITPELRHAALHEGFELFQKQPDNTPRGRIRIAGDRGLSIDLFKNADLSTFIHETGHLYLEILTDLEHENVDLKSDMEILRNWLGAADEGAFTIAQHEQFARGFETYLMEGKAPSSALRGVFAKFRAWLTAIYWRVNNLNVQLTPEVRNVMDRLLASETEITAAEQEQNMQPLFTDPAAVGMSETDAAAYAAAVLDARTTAETELSNKLIASVRKEETAQYRAAEAQIRSEVAVEVGQEPDQIALAVLTTGQLPNGEELPESMHPSFGATSLDLKLSRGALIIRYGKEFIATLPKIFRKEGGLHPDVAADLFGFSSGDALVQAVKNAEPFEQRVSRLTAERMQAEQPDLLLNREELHGEALKAVHSEKRAQVLLKELQILATQHVGVFKGMLRKIIRRVPTIESIRSQAETIIAEKKVRDVNPLIYQRAERIASQNAMDAFLRGDVEQAFEEKQRELLNHELYRAATNARESVDKIVSYMAKFDKTRTRERLAKAGAGYLDQIDTIRERFDFKRGVSLVAVDKRKSLAAWIKEQEALGIPVHISDKVRNEAFTQHYKDATIAELQGIHDSVKLIEHLARLKNKLLANKRTRELEVARAEIINSIATNHDVTAAPLDFAPGFGARFKEKAKGVIAAHTKMEFLFEWLDGNVARGPVWEHLFKPFADAENVENQMMHEAVKGINEIFKEYPRKERALWFFQKQFFPELNTSLTKGNILAIALNWGNLYNRDALMRGYHWTEAQVQTVIDTLDERDWHAVQGVWDFLNSYWPQIEQMEKDLNGLAPPQVEAEEVETQFGTFRGGYYPIVFDSKLSWRQHIVEAKSETQDMFGGNWARAQTKQGHTEARDDTGGKPIKLELTGLSQHVANVIHDLSHRRAVIDVSRLITHATVREAIENSVGREMYRQIHPWLANIASEKRGEFSNPIEGLLSHARTGATVVNMGLKFTTAIVQIFGYTVSIKELGPKYAALGLKDVFSKPWKMNEQYDFAVSRSEMMRDRMSNYDRDVRDALKRLNIAGSKAGVGSVIDTYTHDLQSSFFSLIGYMDMAVSLPTWMGAYRKAMDGMMQNIPAGDEIKAIDYADQSVRLTQGVGAPKDLASIQRGSETFKLFTMFYSYWSVAFNQFQKTTNQFTQDRNIPKLLGSTVLLWLLPAVLDDLLLGRSPDDDDDPEAWYKWFAKKEATYPIQSVILLRDVVNGMDDYGYEPSAAFDFFDSISKAGKLALDVTVNDKDVTRSDVKGLVGTVGYGLHLPSRQMWMSGEYFYDWLTGEVQPDNPAEGLWRGVVTGKKRN